MSFYTRNYAYDRSHNLRQNTRHRATSPVRMFVANNSNRSVGHGLFEQSGSVAPWFDSHGNQLQTGAPALSNGWNALNQLQQTVQVLGGGVQQEEYSVRNVPGHRSRRVTETLDAGGNVTHIAEAVYFDHVEFRSVWEGSNLAYNGVEVTDNGQPVEPTNRQRSMQVRAGHRQVAQRDVFSVQNGQPVNAEETHYQLTNRIDSGQARIKPNGSISGYLGYYPYGETAVEFGDLAQWYYRYSGQEKDPSGLYFYGYRSYLPGNFRWMSPDPSGWHGSGLNRYRMASNNPVTLRDRFGLDDGAIIGSIIGGVILLILIALKARHVQVSRYRKGKVSDIKGLRQLAYGHFIENEESSTSNRAQEREDSIDPFDDTIGNQNNLTVLNQNNLLPALQPAPHDDQRNTLLDEVNNGDFTDVVGRVRTVFTSVNHHSDLHHYSSTFAVSYFFQKGSKRNAEYFKKLIERPFSKYARSGVDKIEPANLPYYSVYMYNKAKNAGILVNLLGNCEVMANLTAHFIAREMDGLAGVYVALEANDDRAGIALRSTQFRLDHVFAIAMDDADAAQFSGGDHLSFDELESLQATVVDTWDKTIFETQGQNFRAHVFRIAAKAARLNGTPNQEQFNAFFEHARMKVINVYRSERQQASQSEVNEMEIVTR